MEIARAQHDGVSNWLPSLRGFPVSCSWSRTSFCQTGALLEICPFNHLQMEILTPKTTRRCTRLRVEIPIVVTSMDRRHAFSGECVALLISPQGCGLRSSRSLPLETPVLLSHLPAGGTASGRVANCLPLGSDGKYFLIGVSLYNPGNIWGVTEPPADWNCAAEDATAPVDAARAAAKGKGKDVWPYNLFSGQGETRLAGK